MPTRTDDHCRANVNHRPSDLSAPLHYASGSGGRHASMHGSKEIIKNG